MVHSATARRLSTAKKSHTFDLALDLLENNADLFKDILTHTFPVQEYRRAFEIVTSKAEHEALKVAFDFR